MPKDYKKNAYRLIISISIILIITSIIIFLVIKNYALGIFLLAPYLIFFDLGLFIVGFLILIVSLISLFISKRKK